MPRFRSCFAAALVLLTAAAAIADDVAMLPLGDPSRAYMLGSGEAGQILSCTPPTAAPITPEALAADLMKADVVVIGENHTNMEGHRTQWRILEALAKTGRPFALGMEFFEIQDDDALARFSRGETNHEAMLEQTGWYAGGAYNFEYYRPLLDTSRSHMAPIHGLNVPRDWIRTVSRQGAEGLTAEQRPAIGELGSVNERHKYMINQLMGGIGAAMPQMFDGMYRGQTTWDAAMATSIVRLHNKYREEGKARTIVAVVGNGHMSHGLGIPERLRTLDPSLVVRTIAPVLGTMPDEDARVHPGFEKKETATFSLGYADYVYILPDDGSSLEYPDVGVRVGPSKEGPAPLEITRVLPGSIGERAGLRVGDGVASIGDEKPTTPAQAGYILGALRWNDRVVWRVVRQHAEGELRIPMLVVPGADAEGEWLKTKPASGLLDAFDPTSDRSYFEQKDLKPAAAHARIATFRNKPVRVDIMRDGSIMEAWNLDSSGRPVLGLLAEPARDGAVRVEITRDESGKATAVRRVDAQGKVIEPPTDATK